MQLHPYEDIVVELKQATPNPSEQLAMALDITQKKDFDTPRTITEKTIKAVLKMNHGSVFEHILYTFSIKGASRSFLAQITRHRIASPTSGSQHYQNYENYHASVDSSLVNNPIMQSGLNHAMECYKQMVTDGVPISEARQVLPNAMQNNLIFTINARSLMNFFNLRLCNRNTNEIKIVATKMLGLVTSHFPELWNLIGPDCYQSHTTCTQGKFSCGKPWPKDT